MKNLIFLSAVLLLSSCSSFYTESLMEQKLSAKSLPIRDKKNYMTRPYIKSIDKGPYSLRDTLRFGNEYVLLDTSPLETSVPGFRENVIPSVGYSTEEYSRAMGPVAKRGYVAVWKTNRDEVWLEKIHIKNFPNEADAEPSEVVMERLSKFVGAPLVDGCSYATWLTGIVQIDDKELRKNKHWEEYYLAIVDGKMIGATRYVAPSSIYDNPKELSAYLTKRLKNKITADLQPIDILFEFDSNGALVHRKGDSVSPMEEKIVDIIHELPKKSINPSFFPPVEIHNEFGTDIFENNVLLHITFDANNQTVTVE